MIIKNEPVTRTKKKTKEGEGETKMIKKKATLFFCMGNYSEEVLRFCVSLHFRNVSTQH
jgi:hypothetical protein